jgi:hypothetical protein
MAHPFTPCKCNNYLEIVYFYIVENLPVLSKHIHTSSLYCPIQYELFVFTNKYHYRELILYYYKHYYEWLHFKRECHLHQQKHALVQVSIKHTCPLLNGGHDMYNVNAM